MGHYIMDISGKWPTPCACYWHGWGQLSTLTVHVNITTESSSLCSYQTEETKFLPKPEWSLHCPASSAQGCRANDQTPPCRSAPSSPQTITPPVGTGASTKILGIVSTQLYAEARAEASSSALHPFLFTRLADPLMGGQHLNCVAPVGMFSAHRLR